MVVRSEAEAENIPRHIKPCYLQLCLGTDAKRYIHQRTIFLRDTQRSLLASYCSRAPGPHIHFNVSVLMMTGVSAHH